MAEETTTFAFAYTPAASNPSTFNTPPTVTGTLGLVRYALANALTLLLARIPPKLLPLAPNRAEAADVAALLTVALICASFEAEIVRSPATSSEEPVMYACTSAGC